jgi:2-polyprenyl-3-methyl-5-hydroxy-6-metoxy-1,4-benzoquinol methylase
METNYGELTNEFCRGVKAKNALHSKVIEESLEDLTEQEISKLENLLVFYKIYGSDTMENIINKYLGFVECLMEEQVNFFRNGYEYRYSKFSEVEDFYKNKTYSENNYTVGLGISQYLWRVHRMTSRFFHQFLKNIKHGGIYFEIGPGHGHFIGTAIEEGVFDSYSAIDLSKTSVEATVSYLQHSVKCNGKKYTVTREDFFEYNAGNLFDVVVMGEVLEHVEKPQMFLNKIHGIIKKDGRVFISTAINAPQPDHIYLFRTLKEVTNLIELSHFRVVDYIAENAQGFSLEKAEKKKTAIVVAFILEKK